MSWKIKVPIFKNRLLLKQIGLAIGIPFGLLAFVMLLCEAYYAFVLIVLLLALTVLFVLILFKGTYDVQFLVNEKGVLCENQPKQQKKLKILSVLAFFAGLFSRNYTAAGAGMLAGTRTKVFLPWKRLRKVKFLGRQNCILLYGGFGENIALFCIGENYEEVKQIILEKMNKNKKQKKK